ncbi:MAG: hypothetical protein A3F40_02480 [Chlamydiae bacterium RIFCSPHIGHO2_12_FULL_27_8]|nr:MAG: hypothetical protein A3F40_02480 [Chlamydiae bacterium RIFCSPHIGHO2_12_FULL_27_8]
MNDKVEIGQIELEIKLKTISSNEHKIQYCLSEMKDAISDGKTEFKKFWEIKHVCLNLFKEQIPSIARQNLWNEYIEISKEMKNLRDILDEHTAFAIEQIELVIQALEEDLLKNDALLDTIKEIEIPEILISLEEKKAYFLKTQKELTLFNSFAARINSLRKEIIKTNMRIKNKNGFLNRLSKIGDEIFPKRKALIQDLSNEFLDSVTNFVNKFDLKNQTYFDLKEHIKTLQSIAKEFTLNTQAFTESRIMLSECWDKVKIAEKEYKKEKFKFKKNIDDTMVKINALKEIVDGNPLDPKIEEEETDILNYMRSIELRKSDVLYLKSKIRWAKSKIYEEAQIEKIKIIEDKKLQVQKKKDEITSLQDAIKSLITKKDFSIDQLEEEKKIIEEKIKDLNLESIQTLLIEKDLKELDFVIEEKKDSLLLNEDDISTFKRVFNNKQTRKKNLKNYQDFIKKELAGSNLDIEKAMIFRDIVNSQTKKIRLLEESINDLEDKIIELESK